MRKLKILLLVGLLLSVFLMTCGRDGDKTEEPPIETETMSLDVPSDDLEEELVDRDTVKFEALAETGLDVGGEENVETSSVSPKNPFVADEMEITMMDAVAITDVNLGGELTESTSSVSVSSKTINRQAFEKLVELGAELNVTSERREGIYFPDGMLPYADLTSVIYLEDLVLFEYYNQQQAYLNPRDSNDLARDDESCSGLSLEELKYPLVRAYYLPIYGSPFNCKNQTYLAIDTASVVKPIMQHDRYTPLIALYKQSEEILSYKERPDYGSTTKEVEFEEKMKKYRYYAEINLIYKLKKAPEYFMRLMADKALELLIQEENRLLAAAAKGEEEPSLSVAPIGGRSLTRGELVGVLPALQQEPLVGNARSSVFAQRDLCKSEAEVYLKQYQELNIALERSKAVLTIGEYDYFLTCLNYLQYVADVWTTSARRLTGIIDLPQDEQTYFLLLMVDEVLTERNEALNNNSHFLKVRQLRMELRNIYYQQVREAEAAFDLKQSEHKQEQSEY